VIEGQRVALDGFDLRQPPARHGSCRRNIATTGTPSSAMDQHYSFYLAANGCARSLRSDDWENV